MFATKRIKDNGGTNRPWNWIEISITTFLFVFLYPISFPIAFFHLETLHRPTPLITHQQIKQWREIKVNSTVRTHQKKFFCEERQPPNTLKIKQSFEVKNTSAGLRQSWFWRKKKRYVFILHSKCLNLWRVNETSNSYRHFKGSIWFWPINFDNIKCSFGPCDFAEN